MSGMQLWKFQETGFIGGRVEREAKQIAEIIKTFY